GEDYYVIVTTADGLYRYDMNDIVRVNGRIHDTPTLEFLQKGKGVTSITGEKLHEVQVLNAVGEALGKTNVESEFFIVLADPATASYTLYLEPRGDIASVPRLAPLVDAALRRGNIEYDGKRASGRLGELRMRWLKPGAGDAFREQRVAGGQRDTQFKYLHLQLAEECGFDFEPFHRPE
ncbi:MAG: GH3 auxin-responsive promoter family protein, partial [Gammaproteobacteria bacterium]|nr:GH3 auxin-responsive promoter family protein [Gammaproteobacteria bacterium]